MSVRQRRQEAPDNSLHKIDQIMKAWQQRFTPSRPQFAKRFLSAGQNIIVHFRTSEDSPEMWAAEFIQKGNANPIPNKPLSVKTSESCHGEKQAMFADIVETMKPPKRFVPTLVRLERVEDFYCFRAEELFITLAGLFVSGFILANRKVDLSELLVGSSGAVCYRQLISEMIERTGKIVNHISSGGQRIERDVIKSVRPWRSLKGLHIHVDARDITVSTENNEFHLAEILFGPLNLRTN